MKFEELLSKLGSKSIESTKERFIDDKSFYVEITEELLVDPGFNQLKVEIDNKNKEQAFEVSHMLKGVIANCGLTPLYETSAKIVDILRKDNPNFYMLQNLYQELLERRDFAKKIIDGECEHDK